jgi:alpha-L-fucosidase
MMNRISRRRFNALAAAVPLAAMAGPQRRASGQATTAPSRSIAPGPFQPTWESLIGGYKCPEWFRDAKFGIWAHWSAQCVPEQGDWYARQMYIQGHAQNRYHVANYGHPTKFGFMELDNLWRAEKWEPEKLVALYKRAGAKYFFALANHHDNFDAYNSKHHAWNSVNVGAKKDIVGTWAKIVRENGLRFGVSNHSAHAWHWFQSAYGYDPEGEFAGQRYDAFTLTKEDGKGKWWEGLDPQELYTGRNILMPDGIKTIAEANAWHNRNDRVWNENPPPNNPAFVEKWFLRCQDLIDQYQPDVLYFDNTELPLGQAGLDIAAHYYNSSLRWHDKLDVVLTAKKMTEAHRAAVVEDIERGVAASILDHPWQTDTCIGSWHYQRSIFERHTYKTTKQVVQMLIDIVSKNGNLMLSIPVRGDGSIDEDEIAFLEALAQWMPINGEAIFGTRPWKIYGEGPSVATTAPAGQFGGARDVRNYTAQDIRFTTKDNTLYAFLMDWPGETATITSLPAEKVGKVQRVDLLGAGEVQFTHDNDGLNVKLPAEKPGAHAFALKISGLKLNPSI